MVSKLDFEEKQRVDSLIGSLEDKKIVSSLLENMMFRGDEVLGLNIADVFSILENGNKIAVAVGTDEDVIISTKNAIKELHKAKADHGIIVYIKGNISESFDKIVEQTLPSITKLSQGEVNIQYCIDGKSEKSSVEVVIVLSSLQGFVRRFDHKNIGKLTSKNGKLAIDYSQTKLSSKNLALYKKLHADVESGIVFPAIRKDAIYFYYSGGCLYKLTGTTFSRDKNYEKYSDAEKIVGEYERAKKQNENKNTSAKGLAKERQILDDLYCYTFDKNKKSSVVVLDIEVRLNGIINGNKKCDLVLLNTNTNEIMFVEGKIFADSRVNVKVGLEPEVVGQVNRYTEAIKEQKERIESEYEKCIFSLNLLFESEFKTKIKVIEHAKLLVFDVPPKLSENNKQSIETINNQLGKNNVLWVKKGDKINLEEIWERLCK